MLGSNIYGVLFFVKTRVVYVVLIFSVMFCNVSAADTNAINQFEYTKYQGLWYEIARFPNRFQEKCKKNVSATYTLLENNHTKIVNVCEKENKSKMVVTGLARSQSKTEPWKLEVSFFSVLGWRPLWSDAWVLYIDPDYTMSVVGERKKGYGWILSRDRFLTKEKFELALSIFKANGYDIDAITMTVHDKQ